ncbi:MAG: outer membrane beta-barrel protein, partial [Gallionella sp.]
LSLSSFDVAFVGSLPLTQQFDLLGKIGFANNSEQYSDASGGYDNYSQSDFMYGFGAEFYVSPQVGLRAMYNNYGKFDTFDPPVKVSSFTLGMVYNFY